LAGVAFVLSSPQYSGFDCDGQLHAELRL